MRPRIVSAASWVAVLATVVSCGTQQGGEQQENSLPDSAPRPVITAETENITARLREHPELDGLDVINLEPNPRSLPKSYSVVGFPKAQSAGELARILEILEQVPTEVPLRLNFSVVLPGSEVQFWNTEIPTSKQWQSMEQALTPAVEKLLVSSNGPEFKLTPQTPDSAWKFARLQLQTWPRVALYGLPAPNRESTMTVVGGNLEVPVREIVEQIHSQTPNFEVRRIVLIGGKVTFVELETLSTQFDIREDRYEAGDINDAAFGELQHVRRTAEQYEVIAPEGTRVKVRHGEDTGEYRFDSSTSYEKVLGEQSLSPRLEAALGGKQ